MPSNSAAQAMLALNVWDSGFRSLDPNIRMLTAIQAIEILLSDSTESPQSLRIARRAAYLACPGGCGRTAPHCLYTRAFWTTKPLFDEICRRASEDPNPWECGAFLGFAAPRDLLPALLYTPLYEVRNQLVHEGRASLSENERSTLLSRAERVLRAAMAWLADHPGCDIEDLDRVMNSHVNTGSRVNEA